VNHALAEYYGTPVVGDPVKVSGDRARVTELHHLRNVVSGCGGFRGFPKASAEVLDRATEASELVRAAVEYFGGSAVALEKASADLPWVRTFSEAERDGLEIAEHGMKALFERAAEAVQS